MNFKTTYLLFGLLGLMLAVLGIVLVNGPSGSGGRGKVFPSMKAADNPLVASQVEKIVIERKKENEPDLVFERTGDETWKITAPRATPADSRQVSALVDQLMNADLDDKEKAPGLAKAGLESPSRTITLHAGDRQWVLSIGTTTPGVESALAYVLSSDEPGKPLVVRKQAIEAALEGLNYFRAKELLGENTAAINSIKFSSNKKGAVVLKKDKERWTLTQPSYGDVDIGQLLTQLTDLRVDFKGDKQSDFVKDGVTNLADFKELDPAKSEILRIEVTRDIKGESVKQAALIGLSQKAGDKFYAAFDTGKAKDVVKVAASAVEPIRKWLDDPGAFRSKSLLALESFRQPDAIDIDNSYGKLEFRHPDAAKPWDLYRGAVATNVDETEIRKLIAELTKKDAVVSFPDLKRRKELGLEKPDVTVRVYSESLDKPDPKKPGKVAFKKGAKPVTELRFGHPEGGNVAVERVWGNDKALVMVPQAILDQVRKGPMSYFDKSLPSFNSGSAEENVTQVELKRGGQTFVITRKPGAAPWVIEQPVALKGRHADEQTMREILGELNRLTAREIVTEKADAKEHASKGLAVPTIHVAVTFTKAGKPATATFDFGSEAAGKGVYLKLAGKEAIYLVGLETLVSLNKELRDTAVFTFDQDKVVSLSVRGKTILPGFDRPLTFEQKNGTWTTTEKGYNFDKEKVVALVAGLSRLRLEKFMPAGKGLTPAEGALQIEVTLSDKKVLKLTVGAPEGDSYIATSEQHKGDFFLVRKALFEKIRDTQAYFTK